MDDNRLGLGGGGLAGIGVVMLFWALFWDRARGRKRCPKCWYDMSGAVAASAAGPWVCPECGRSIHSQDQMLRTRRRRDAMVAFAVLWVLSYCIFAMPRIKLSGRWGLIPNTVLILGFGWLERPSLDEQRLWLAGQSLTTRQHLFMDFRRNRFDKNLLDRWQRWLLYERILLGDPDKPNAREEFDARYADYLQYMSSAADLTDRQRRKLLDWVAPWVMRVRDHWPTDVAVPVEIHAYGYFDDPVRGRILRAKPIGVDGASVETPMMGPSWWRDATNSGAWERHASRIGPVAAGTTHIDFELTLVEFDRKEWEAGMRTEHLYWKRRISFPITVAGSIRDVMQPVRTYDPFLELLITYRLAARKMLLGMSISGSRTPEEVDRILERVQKYSQGWSDGHEDEVIDASRVKLVLPEGTLDMTQCMRLGTVIVQMDMVVCGLRMELLQDGQVVANHTAWGIGAPRSGGTNYGDGELIHGLFKPVSFNWLAPVPSVEAAERSKWSLRLVGDPSVAIGYWGSDRYWEGEFELPVDLQRAQLDPK